MPWASRSPSTCAAAWFYSHSYRCADIHPCSYIIGYSGSDTKYHTTVDTFDNGYRHAVADSNSFSNGEYNPDLNSVANRNIFARSYTDRDGSSINTSTGIYRHADAGYTSHSYSLDEAISPQLR